MHQIINLSIAACFNLALFSMCSDSDPSGLKAERIQYIKKIKKDVPIFLIALSKVRQNDLKSAFQQIKAELNYNLQEFPSSANDLKAESRKPGESHFNNIQLIYYQNEQYPSITLYVGNAPPGLLEEITSRVLTNLLRKDLNGLPTWNLNGWMVQIKNDFIEYTPILERKGQ